MVASMVTELRILVVDDHVDTANTIATILRLLGNDVSIAYGGAQAVEMAGSLRPQLIIMDIGMPGINGHQATRLIRKEPWGANIVIIALSGWAQDEDLIETEAAGCNGHLVKPVQLSDLKRLLSTWKVSRTDGS